MDDDASWPALTVPGAPGTEPGVAVVGPRRLWDGPLDVEGLAVASVREAARAAVSLAARRGVNLPIAVDSRDVAAAFESFRHLRVAGRAPEGFAPLSTFYAATDGWVRVHANYPHHRHALTNALEVTDDGDPSVRERVAAAIASMPAHAVETRVRATGGVAAALRTPQAWRAHEHGRLVTAQPLVDVRATGAPAAPVAPADDLPLTGLRVLDLTRVIAGPTATRLLGALGADVLRLDPPGRPELLDQHLDTGFAKRSAVGDLADPATRARVEELLATADVVVSGYRPGALTTFGLDADSLLARRPGLVVAELSAWGTDGPWGHERGFDSIVQVAAGIAHRYGRNDDAAPGGWRPGALPVQALDHAAGYLLAATVMRLLAGRVNEGGAVARISLARVAEELLRLPGPGRESSAAPTPADAAPMQVAPAIRHRESAYGVVEYVPPRSSWPATGWTFRRHRRSTAPPSSPGPDRRRA
ncbi:CoA transferase, partial [Georgenia yuyongxinii]